MTAQNALQVDGEMAVFYDRYLAMPTWPGSSVSNSPKDAGGSALGDVVDVVGAGSRVLALGPAAAG